MSEIDLLQKRARILFLALLFLFLATVLATESIYPYQNLFQNKIVKPLSDWWQNQLQEESAPSQPTTSWPSRAPSPFLSPRPKKHYYHPQPASRCWRYTVPHLDGSTSRLCYSRTDYNRLVQLGSQLSSAKTFYRFYLDGIKDYQDQYDITKSKIYLDAQESMRRKAEREKEKISQIILQMQAIEKRGRK